MRVQSFLMIDLSGLCSWRQIQKVLQPPWTSMREKLSWSSTTLSWNQSSRWHIKSSCIFISILPSLCSLYSRYRNVCWQNLQNEKEIEAHLEKLKESVSSLEGVLHRTTAPNLKALEKMREVKDKLQGVMEGNLFDLCFFISKWNSCLVHYMYFHLRCLIIYQDRRFLSYLGD